DGNGLSQIVPLSGEGAGPLYISLYGGNGSILGWLLYDTNIPSATLQADLSWIKPARPGAQFYPAGFTNQTSAVGSRYAPLTGNRVIDLTNGIVTFESGNLSAPFMNLVTLSQGNKI